MFWCKKVETFGALASENKDPYLLRRDTVWGCEQWKVVCCLSWTSSSASQKSQVGEERAGVPCCGLKAKGVDTQSETGNTANDISWEISKHVLGKAVRRTSSQGFFWGQCTPSVISENFAFVLLWAAIRIVIGLDNKKQAVLLRAKSRGKLQVNLDL